MRSHIRKCWAWDRTVLVSLAGSRYAANTSLAAELHEVRHRGGSLALKQAQVDILRTDLRAASSSGIQEMRPGVHRQKARVAFKTNAGLEAISDTRRSPSLAFAMAKIPRRLKQELGKS